MVNVPGTDRGGSVLEGQGEGLEREDQSVSHGGSGCAGAVEGEPGPWLLRLLYVWGGLEQGMSETTGGSRGLEEKPVAASAR